MSPEGATPSSRLTSGHSWVQKSGFAMSLVSPLACASVFVLAKDIYVLEMAADIQVMAVVGVVVAIWGPTSYVLAGGGLSNLVHNWGCNFQGFTQRFIRFSLHLHHLLLPWSVS